MTHLTKTLLAGAVAFGLVITSIGGVTPASAASAPLNPSPAQTTAGNELSDDEIAGLTYMREEEKLARDVYLTLGEAWDSQVFGNIARSEQNHMDAIETLLDRYDIVDPAAGNDIGEFTNPELQALYDELVDQGLQSLTDGLRAGALIEEVDINDLIEELALVEHSDIQRVFERLQQGSENHLRAFVTALERQAGETYQPQVLDQATYDQIVNATAGNGQGRGRGRGRTN